MTLPRLRYLLLSFLCLLPVTHVFSQERLFFGRVLDTHGRGIPRAIVEITGKFNGVYCDSQGRWALTANVDSIRGITAYCMGYERKNISKEKLTGDSLIIHLNEGFKELDDYILTGKRKKIRERVLGRKNLSPSGGCYMMYGDEVAIYLAADPAKRGFLKEVFFYITGDGKPESKFRMHVYRRDSAGLFPGYDVLDSEVVLHAYLGNEWVKADLSSRRIPVHDGIFISVEWVQDYGNSDDMLVQQVYPQYYIAGSNNKRFNGQVLGLTTDYGLQQLHFISNRDHHELWDFQDPIMGADSKKFGSRIRRWYNPMIYATYTYVKR